MPNGGGPPDRVLKNADYQIIKTGDCIISGPYKGCIQLNSTYYWIRTQPYSAYWDLQSGSPGEDQNEIPSDIWEKCCHEGSLDWDAKKECWYDSGSDTYWRWAGYIGSNVTLKQVEE